MKFSNPFFFIINSAEIIRNIPRGRVGIRKIIITNISPKPNHKIIFKTKELKPLSTKIILSFLYNESEKCQQQINKISEHSINTNFRRIDVL